eukprot:TRINITY_DN25410_c0_g1_i1.p1 TRINITY_DN25410_c0_g1~~TRINITY_DN25410_c0_g1_i1.p1  ORF type:complete len:372 (+),score=95.36 TRINITY_DN25410_c0_g1_i1:80-1117(+)
MAGGGERFRVAVLVGPSYDEPLSNCDPSMAEKLQAAGVAVLRLGEAERAAAAGDGVDGVLCAQHSAVDGALLDRLGPKVRVVSNYGVGLDHVRTEEVRSRGVRLGHTPGVLSGATADMAWALLMAAARRIPEGHEHSVGPNFTKYENMIFLGTDVHGTTLGIVGMGRIGEEVARRGKGFGMRILYHNRSRKPQAEAELGAEYRALDALLSESDHVVLVCPLTEQTRGLIGAPQLRLMKPTATLVNIARGPVVDTAALTEALRSRSIFAAGLDVTDPEPLPRDHPLLRLKEGLVIAPHRGSATAQSRAAMLDLTLRNLVAGLRGEPMPAEFGAAGRVAGEKRPRED